MGEQTIDRAFEIAAIGHDRLGDIGHDRRRHVEIGLRLLRGGDARLQNLHAQFFVERADVDAEPALEAREHALVESLEIGRRTVGGDDDLLAGVDERVQRVAELLLDRLALQKLHIVDDQHVDVAQLLLEGDRRMLRQRRDEAAHELLGRQIEHATLIVIGRARDRLQQMRLAESDGGMRVERIEQRMLAGTGVGDATGGRIGELVGGADQKGRERETTIERRAAERLALAAPRRAHGRLGGLRLDALDDGGRLRLLGRRAGGGVRIARTRAACRRTHVDDDLLERSEFGEEPRANAIRVMSLNPALQEFRRHRQQCGAALRAFELQPRKPGIIDRLAELGAQPTPHALPFLPVLGRHFAGIRLVFVIIGHGFLSR